MIKVLQAVLRRLVGRPRVKIDASKRVEREHAQRIVKVEVDRLARQMEADWLRIVADLKRREERQ